MMTPKLDAWNFVNANFQGEWFDGEPLGNGDLGALMMAQHKQTVFSLAKSDLWDERCDDGTGQRHSFRPFRKFAELQSLIESEKWDEIDERFDAKMKQWKGKFCLLPAGRLVLNTVRFEKEIEVLKFHQHLDMQHALADTAFHRSES